MSRSSLDCSFQCIESYGIQEHRLNDSLHTYVVQIVFQAQPDYEGMCQCHTMLGHLAIAQARHAPRHIIPAASTYCLSILHLRQIFSRKSELSLAHASFPPVIDFESQNLTQWIL